jgi:cellobiose phosphorylase
LSNYQQVAEEDVLPSQVLLEDLILNDQAAVRKSSPEIINSISSDCLSFHIIGKGETNQIK